MKDAIEDISPKRLLEVPFDEKDFAKSLGALWLPKRKKWFIPKNLSAEKAERLYQQWGELFPGEDRSFGGNSLFVDLVPESCWFTNVRSCVSPGDWEKIRRRVYSRANNRCECCGAERSPEKKIWIEAHERWAYDETTRVQKLMRLVALCSPCHLVTHFGFAQMQGLENAAYQHLRKVAGFSDLQAQKHVEDAFLLWEKRSSRVYEMDLSLLLLSGIKVLEKQDSV